MTATINIIQALLLIAVAPLVRGVIARIKARIQNRRGASVLRPYADLWKLLRKEDLVPPSASPVFRLAPIVIFAVTAVVAAFVPVLAGSALLGVTGDFILLVYLLALGRFFLMLGALDGGSAFGGMGASREALVSTLAEAPLLLGLTSVAIVAHTASIAGIVQWTLGQDFTHLSAIHALAFAALAVVAIAETGRIPVDNPTTHLELTMIHEAMVLEYSARHLALVEWASSLKLFTYACIGFALFLPWGMAGRADGVLWLLPAVPPLLLKLAAAGAGIALIETLSAKLRIFRAPEFLATAFLLSVLALLVRLMLGT